MRKERVEIKKLGINGEGIGYIHKKICFIQDALPGEIVDVEIVQEIYYKCQNLFMKVQKLDYKQLIM